jgi:hypothetical protein
MKLAELKIYCYDKLGRVLSGNAQKKIISKCEDYNILPGNSLPEKLYLLNNNLTEIPKCPVCQKPLTFYKSFGYLQYCSNKCKANSKLWKLNRLGKGFQSPEVQNKIKTIKENHTPEKKEKIKLSIKETLLKKGNLWRTSEETIKNTIQKIESIYKYKVNSYELKNNEIYYKLHCNIHNYNWEWSRVEKETQTMYPICIHCHNEKQSKYEKEIVEFIKSIYSGEIQENTRRIIPPKELDIYLPELKLAIEYNGTYWHGFHKHSFYTLDELKNRSSIKREYCQKKGIKLISIDECDYLDRPEVFKRFLQDQILPRKRIFARKCEIKEIDTQVAREFCEYYHVNGFRGASKKLGLFHNNELLIVALFGKYKEDYECIRLCYKTGIDVIGGWNKIQKHFGKKFLHYVNLKYFNGENKTGIGYRFCYRTKVLHRNSLQRKTQLSKYCKNINSTQSDFKNCIENGLIAIFDCGNDIRWYNN